MSEERALNLAPAAVDDARVYKRALTTSEIDQEYQHALDGTGGGAWGRVRYDRDGNPGLHYAHPEGRRRWPAPVRASKLNLGCGPDVRSTLQGWVSMDAFHPDPRVVKHDMARTPWPFLDGQFDYVYASHVLEHVPLIYRERDGVQRDVLFDVMEELHRVLKPGGELHIIVPFGGRGMGYSNPQHYRQWRPDWLRWWDPSNEEGSHYGTARFRLARMRFNRSGLVAPYAFPLGPGRHGISLHLSKRLPWLRWALAGRQEIEAVLERA